MVNNEGRQSEKPHATVQELSSEELVRQVQQDKQRDTEFQQRVRDANKEPPIRWTN